MADQDGNNRVILVIDIDAYEYQVWLKKECPELRGKDVPVVVVNASKIILSLNYKAKGLGIARTSSLDEAKEKAKTAGVQLFEIYRPVDGHGVEDTFTLQVESDEIISSLLNYKKNLVEPAEMVIHMFSKDEYHIDVTNLVKRMQITIRQGVISFGSESENLIACLYELTTCRKSLSLSCQEAPVTILEGKEGQIHGQELKKRIENVLGSQQNDDAEERLLLGAIIARRLMEVIKREIRKLSPGEIAEFTGYDSSIGVGHNILTARLAYRRNRPQGITIFAEEAKERLSKEIKFQDIPSFGGEFGKTLRDEYGRQQEKKLEFLCDVQLMFTEGLCPANDEIAKTQQRVRLTELCNNIRGKKLRFPKDIDLKLLDASYFVDNSPVQAKLFADTLVQSLSVRSAEYPLNQDSLRRKLKVLTDLFLAKLESKYYYYRVRPTVFNCAIKQNNATTTKAIIKLGSRKSKKSESTVAIPSSNDIQEKALAFIIQKSSAEKVIQKIELKASKFVPSVTKTDD